MWLRHTCSILWELKPTEASGWCRFAKALVAIPCGVRVGFLAEDLPVSAWIRLLGTGDTTEVSCKASFDIAAENVDTPVLGTGTHAD